MTNLQEKIKSRITKEKAEKKELAELEKNANILVKELGIEKVEAIEIVKQETAELEKEKKIEKWLKILEDLGFKFPDKIYMSYWDRITAVQKLVEKGTKTEIQVIAEILAILNTGTVNNTKLKDSIINMWLEDFEKVSLLIGRTLEGETNKKK